MRSIKPAARASSGTVMVLVDRELYRRAPPYLPPQSMEQKIVGALQDLGWKCVIYPFLGPQSLWVALTRHRPDVVFNLTEHADGDREKDASIAGILELRGTPFTGTGSRGLTLCRDKAFSKLVAEREGFKIPRFFTLEEDHLTPPPAVPYPVLVKPRFSDASEGIEPDSLVSTPNELLSRVRSLRRQGVTRLICEEFIEGREIYVGTLGESIQRPREMTVTNGKPLVAGYRLKHNDRYRKKCGVRYDFAALSDRQLKRLRQLVLRTAAALDIRDYGRLDVRLSPSGHWYFLEANPNPGLFPFANALIGTWSTEFGAVVSEIVQRAWQRASK